MASCLPMAVMQWKSRFLNKISHRSFAFIPMYDTDGNVWSSAGWAVPVEKDAVVEGSGELYDGVHVFSAEGKRIGQIKLPEVCSNVCFGGPRRNRLFMTASQSLYAVYVEAVGAHWC